MEQVIEAKPAKTADARSLGVVYVVCVGRVGSMPEGQSVGFEVDQSTRVHIAAGLAALTVSMPHDYLSGPEAEARLGDIDWLAPRAVRHEELVRHAMASGPILPMRFGTVFSSALLLCELMAKYAPLVESFLERITGRAEYAVRIAYDREAGEKKLFAQLVAQAPTPSGPGVKYLLEKRIKEQAARELTSHMAGIGNEVAGQLAEFAADSVVRRAVADRGDGLETAAAHALLVDSSKADALTHRSQQLSQAHADAGIRIELTGPWPAYSFCPSVGGAL